MDMVILFGTYFVVALCFFLVPYAVKKNILFGISIPLAANTDEDVQAVRKRFSKRIVIGSMGGFLILCLAYWPLGIPIAAFVDMYNIILFILVLLYALVYFLSYKEAKTLKEQKAWNVKKPQRLIVDTAFRHQKLVISFWFYLAYLPLLFVPVAMPMYRQTHSFSELTQIPEFVYLGLSQILTLLLMFFVHHIIVSAKQDISGTNSELRRQQNVLFRYRSSVFVWCCGLVTNFIMALSQIQILGFFARTVWIIPVASIGSLLVAVSALALLIRSGQGGWRIHKQKHAEKHDQSDDELIQKDDDKFWKLGSFYYNPEDPAVFVEKRFGIGWTCNFARIQSWLFIVGLLILIVVMTLLPFGGLL